MDHIRRTPGFAGPRLAPSDDAGGEPRRPRSARRRLRGPARVHLYRARARCRRRHRLRVHLSDGGRGIRRPMPLVGARGRRARWMRSSTASSDRWLADEWPFGRVDYAARDEAQPTPYAKDPRVDAYIDALPDWQQAICRRVRDLVHAADPEVDETIKRTVQPYFVLDGNICALLAAKDHVNVFLYDGAIVPDPEGIITAGHGNTTARTVAFRRGRDDQRGRADARCSARSSPTTGPAAGASSRAADAAGSTTRCGRRSPARPRRPPPRARRTTPVAVDGARSRQE